ncbi:MAG: hypothetical protein E7432_04320 [Ruminococcaceae bacterium]|nr:hypothetical protein [Oscillospiraceae bacterium]
MDEKMTVKEAISRIENFMEGLEKLGGEGLQRFGKMDKEYCDIYAEDILLPALRAIIDCVKKEDA